MNEAHVERVHKELRVKKSSRQIHWKSEDVSNIENVIVWRVDAWPVGTSPSGEVLRARRLGKHKRSLYLTHGLGLEGDKTYHVRVYPWPKMLYGKAISNDCTAPDFDSAPMARVVMGGA